MYIYQKTINNSDCGKVTFRNSIHKMPDIFYFNFGNRKHVTLHRRLQLDKTNKLN